MREHGAGKEILRGDLRDVSLNSLLQLTRAEAVSGWIRVMRLGEVGLAEGRVVNAQCGALGGLGALRELLFYDSGRFAIVRGTPAGMDIVDDVLPVVMDAYRLRDEWARVANAVLRRAPGRPWAPAGGSADAVIEKLDGESSVADILARLDGVVITPLIDALLAALDEGIVERVHVATRQGAAPPVVPAWPLRASLGGAPRHPPTQAARVPPMHPLTQAPASLAGLAATSAASVEPADPAGAPDDEFFDLVDRGHELMRTEQFVAAEEVLRRALAIRPGDRVVSQNLRALARRRGAH